MKTYEEFRYEIMEADHEVPISHAQIEDLAAKEYAKQWIDQAAEVAMNQSERGLPVGDAIFALKDLIDKQ